MYLAKECKVVSSNVPADVNGAGAITGDYVSMKGWSNLAIILHFGAVGDAGAVTLKQATDVGNSLSDEKALPFSFMYKNEGLTTDTLTETAVTSNTFNHAATASNLYVIEVDARQLDTANGFDCVRVNVAAQTGAATLLGILYILSGSRYSGNDISSIVD